MVASPGERARHHGKTRFLETTIDAARTFSIEHEILDAADVTGRFPQFALNGDETGYFEPGGGFVRPEAAVSAQLELAARSGAVLHTDETLTGYRATSGGVSVTTSRGRYAAGVLVLAVGAWIASLLEERLAHEFTITRQVVQWYAVKGPIEPYLPARLPAFIWDSGPTSFYGLPAIDGRDGGVKVAGEQATPSATIDDVSREVRPDERYSLYDTIVGKRLPGLSRRCVRAVTCLYTTTRDGDFVIDRHPDHASVIVVSPCSGHGFKHSAAIGEEVAALALGETPKIDLTPFSLARLVEGGGPMGSGAASC